ncbi:tRNA pseudouridine13 synthase [Thermodesulfovibrio aggregans]|uniref:tRNA pseudouridine synthase D n=1 Tax=Thermodesulfovibrio aggregans TaxID=86166 RepID=A0A0U9HX04_9BACT|nr:tRNA pseudouridine(13) synthase TruD [Thermodesulfovibrio aggregans]GAQ95617.1 tRNA pseudouridine13 synthase [Thermodesulfovibrio aggregans]
MSYKVKTKPEDFIVKEISSIPLRQKGQYNVFLLKKTGWNTVDLLKKIAHKLKIPFNNISYGGKKDRHGITEQFITIKNFYRKINLKEDHFELIHLGFSVQPMTPQLIEGNAFKITVRALSEKMIDLIKKTIEKIKIHGFVNYFDDQRFGSFDPKQGFIAEKILKGHYNGALKIYLTHIYPEDKKLAKERKRKIFENWGNWSICLSLAKTKFEKFTFSYLIENPKDYLLPLQKITKEEMSMFFSAYQSFIWNETVKRLIKNLLPDKNLLYHKGITGDYIFFDEIDKQNFAYLKTLQIPLASSKAKISDATVERIYNEILNERQIRPAQFNLKKIRQAFFKSTQRAVIVIPKINYKIEDDEIYQGKKKLLLEFVLPRGSYATMVIKRIFAKNK